MRNFFIKIMQKYIYNKFKLLNFRNFLINYKILMFYNLSTMNLNDFYKFKNHLVSLNIKSLVITSNLINKFLYQNFFKFQCKLLVIGLDDNQLLKIIEDEIFFKGFLFCYNKHFINTEIYQLKALYLSKILI